MRFNEKEIVSLSRQPSERAAELGMKGPKKGDGNLSHVDTYTLWGRCDCTFVSYFGLQLTMSDFKVNDVCQGWRLFEVISKLQRRVITVITISIILR